MVFINEKTRSASNTHVKKVVHEAWDSFEMRENNKHDKKKNGDTPLPLLRPTAALLSGTQDKVLRHASNIGTCFSMHHLQYYFRPLLYANFKTRSIRGEVPKISYAVITTWREKGRSRLGAVVDIAAHRFDPHDGVQGAAHKPRQKARFPSPKSDKVWLAI